MANGRENSNSHFFTLYREKKSTLFWCKGELFLHMWQNIWQYQISSCIRHNSCIWFCQKWVFRPILGHEVLQWTTYSLQIRKKNTIKHSYFKRKSSYQLRTKNPNTVIHFSYVKTKPRLQSVKSCNLQCSGFKAWKMISNVK